MGKQWTVLDFIFGSSKITADGDCSHEIKRRLLLGRKVITNLDSIFKSRDIMVFPVVIYGCENWTVKKAEPHRIDGFELWCWRRRLRVPWTARRSNQSIFKEVNPGISLEGMMLKLTVQYFGQLMWRVDSLEKTPMLGGIGGRKKRGWQRMRWLDSITDSMDMSVGLWRRPSAEELMVLNCGVGEDSWESLGLQGDPTSPFWRRSTLGFLWKEWC